MTINNPSSVYDVYHISRLHTVLNKTVAKLGDHARVHFNGNF